MSIKSNQELLSLIIIFVFGYSVMVFLKPMMTRRVEGIWMDGWRGPCFGDKSAYLKHDERGWFCL